VKEEKKMVFWKENEKYFGIFLEYSIFENGIFQTLIYLFYWAVLMC